MSRFKYEVSAPSWVSRDRDERRLRDGLSRAPIVLVTGPRQAGKSTLARGVVRPAPSNHFDLEDPPRITPSIRRALEDLDLARVLVVHAGDRRFPLAPRVEAIPARDLLTRGFER